MASPTPLNSAPIAAAITTLQQKAPDPTLLTQKAALQSQIQTLMTQLQAINAQLNTPEAQAAKILTAIQAGADLPPQLLNRLGVG